MYAHLLLFLTALPLLLLLELPFIGNSALQARLWSPASDRFGDFWHYRYLLQFLHRPEFFEARDRFAYPAPCAAVYKLLYALGPYPHVSFNLLLWAAEGISAGLLVRALVHSGLRTRPAVLLSGLMLATSYPWHCLYDRGNIELVVYLLIGLGVWAWLLEFETAAAVLWGCAGAMKLYPVVLLALYVRRRHWQPLAVGLATWVGVLLVSFWWVGPTMLMAAKGTMWGVRGFAGVYGAHIRLGELVLDHSLLGGMKEILALPFIHLGEGQILFAHVYELIVILAGPPLFLRWARTARPVNQLCLLLVAMVSLPPVSYDYTLVYEYIVIGIVFCNYVKAQQEGRVFPGAKAYGVAFALLCTPENWIDLFGFEPNGLLKSAALVTTAVLLVRFPLQNEGPLRQRSGETLRPMAPALEP